MSSNVIFLTVLVCVCSSTGQVQRDQFFPFGPSNADEAISKDSSNSDFIALTTPFTFFNTSHARLFIHPYRNIHFVPQGFRSFWQKCDSVDMGSYGVQIAPFWLYRSLISRLVNGGHVHYRETMNSTLISKAHDEVKKGFPDVGELTLKSLFIITWENVSHIRQLPCRDERLRNTFQTILTTDGQKSFVIFYYNEITRTVREADNRPFGYGEWSCEPDDDGYPAAAGFTAGVGHSFQHVLGNCESDVQKLTEKSNVDEKGKWVFRVDREIETPTFLEYIKTHESIQDGISNLHSPNQSDSKDFDLSASGNGIISSIRIYFYAIILILCVYISREC